MRRLPQLHLDAVVGIAVSGKDVQAPAPGRSQLLGDDPYLAKVQPSRAVGEPVLQPDLVVAEVAQLGRLPCAHREPERIRSHEHHRS